MQRLLLLWFLLTMVCLAACSDDPPPGDAGADAPIDVDAATCASRGNLQVSIAASEGRVWVRVDGLLLALAGQSATGRILRSRDGVQLSESPIRAVGGVAALIVTAEPGDELCVQVGGRQQAARVPGMEPITTAVIEPGANTTWAGTVRVLSDLVVAPGQTLSIAPGTVVRMAPGGRVRIEGTLTVDGSAEAPVLIAGEDAARFAEWLLVDASATFRHVFVSGGGAGVWSFGADRHCCRPMVRVQGGALDVESVTFVDTPGAKGLLAESADVTIRASLFSNLGHGSEYFVPEGFRLLVEDTVATELRGPDDSDGLYVWERGDIRIERLTVWGADDDGVDSETTNAQIVDVVVSDVRDRCLSFTSGSPAVDGALLLRCSVGIKFDVRPDRLVSRPTVQRVTLADIRSAALFLSARYGPGTPDGDIQPAITRVVIGEVGTPPLVTDYDPADVRLSDSVVPESLVGVTEARLIRGTPRFVNPALSDYRLAADAPGRELGAGYFP